MNRVKLHSSTYTKGTEVYSFISLDGGGVLLSQSDISDPFQFSEIIMSSEMVDRFLQFIEGRCV